MPASAHEPEKQLTFEHPHLGDIPRKYFHVGFRNNYYSEGRDNLDGDNLLEASFEYDWRNLSSRLTYAKSPDTDYEHMQLSFGITKEIDDFKLYTTYTHIQYISDRLADNEVGIGSAYSGLPFGFGVSLDGYYSFDAHGAFWELALNHENALTNQLSFSQSAILGINQNYVTNGHNGKNHVQLLADTEYKISAKTAVIAYVGYSWELDANDTKPGDDTLGNLFNSGIDFRWSF